MAPYRICNTKYLKSKTCSQSHKYESRHSTQAKIITTDGTLILDQTSQQQSYTAAQQSTISKFEKR